MERFLELIFHSSSISITPSPMEISQNQEIHNSSIKLRQNPQRKKHKVLIGCGAGFGGDRPIAALKLLDGVEGLDYIVLECLAERTLADRWRDVGDGGVGFDPRMDPMGAQEKVLEIASSLRLNITVGVAHEVSIDSSGMHPPHPLLGISTYLGAAPIVKCLEMYNPHVIITSRVADAALFLGPMVYELGWNWDDLELLAQGTLAGHLLECGCQLTGGYFMHPGDRHRDMSFQHLLEITLPYAEVGYDGEVYVAKPDGSGGVLDFSTCAEQLLYEIGDPSAYITPDVALDIRNVTFKSFSSSKVLCAGAKASAQSVPEKLLRLVPKDCGWKGWGEISYGGYGCATRARAAEFLMSGHQDSDAMRKCTDLRLRMDGLFKQKEQAVQFTKEFTALYTNGPAGGGGISTGYKKEIVLEKHLVERESVFWRTGARSAGTRNIKNQGDPVGVPRRKPVLGKIVSTPSDRDTTFPSNLNLTTQTTAPIPSGMKVPLYEIAHSRAGDKGNDLNFSLIPHFPGDHERLKKIITPKWVKEVLSSVLSPSSFSSAVAINDRDKWVEENVKVEIYEVEGIHSLNVVVRNILDGGVNCSRRIDRHGKTVSDVILSQQVVLP
ncbi:hypothetical protein AKJ16_DCAP17353 [Drosera capensis]